MATTTTNVKIMLRRDTAANWTSANPTLSIGEPGFEIDTKKLKIGDGKTAWKALPYVSGSGESGGGTTTDPSYQYQIYKVDSIEDSGMWLRVAELNFDNEYAIANGYVRVSCINQVEFYEGEEPEVRSIRLGNAEFAFSASKTDGLKIKDTSEVGPIYNLDITPIVNSMSQTIPNSGSSASPLYVGVLDLLALFRDKFIGDNTATGIGSGGSGGGSSSNMVGLSHVRLAVSVDDPSKCFLEFFYRNATIGDQKIFLVETINSNNITLLEDIKQINNDYVEVSYKDTKFPLSEGATIPESKIIIPIENTYWGENEFDSAYTVIEWDSNGNRYSLQKVEYQLLWYHHIANPQMDMLLGTYNLIKMTDDDGYDYLKIDSNEDLVFKDVTYIYDTTTTRGTTFIYLESPVYIQEVKTLFDTPVGQATLEDILSNIADELSFSKFSE